MAVSADVAQLIVALKLDDSGFTGRLNAAAGALGRMDGGLSQMGRGVGQVGAGLTRLATVGTVAAVGGLTAVVTTAASFEQAFTGVEKTVDATEAQFGELEDTLKKMAGSTGTSFEELAAIGEAGGALGIGVDDLEQFIDVVNRLSVSTNLSSDQASTALGQLNNILNLTGDELVGLGDSLVALGNAGASTEDQIVEMAARFAAAGNSAGLSTEEILGLSSAVASMGIEVEAGGSSLSRLFNQTTTNIGLANKKAKTFAESLGLTFEEFKKAWDTDALGTFEDLLKHLRTLDQFEGAALLKGLGITNTRDINTIMLMAQNYEFLGEQIGVAEDAQGALNKESDKFFGTTARGWGRLKENVRNAAATIGDQLLPIVNEQMEEFIGWLNKAETQEGLKDFAKDLAEGVRGLVSELKGTDWSALMGTFRGAAEIAKGAFDLFLKLPEPVKQLAIAAIVANKVTGGAFGSLAKGLGNIVLGGLKTIMATNVTVIGGNVTGGGGGVPGAPAGGGLGGILTGVVGTAAAGATVAGGVSALGGLQSNDEGEATQAILDLMGGFPTLIGRAVSDALGLDQPIDVTDSKAEAELQESQGELRAHSRHLRDIWERTGRAEAAIRDATPWAIRNATAVERLQAETATADANLLSTAQSQTALQQRTAAATEATSQKDFNPEVNVHAQFVANVSIHDQQRITVSARTAYSDLDNSAGI